VSSTCTSVGSPARWEPTSARAPQGKRVVGSTLYVVHSGEGAEHCLPSPAAGSQSRQDASHHLPMRAPGVVLSYLEMCQDEGASLQQGMNFRLRGGASVILMSVRPGAPYADQVEDGGRILVYEGHDVPRTRGGPDPRLLIRSS
jgi:hypothetical protein